MMKPHQLYKIAGILSVVFGIFAAVCLVNIRTIPAAMMLSLSGFIFSTINIFIDSKYQVHDKRFPLGYIGMIFSSIPVLLFLYLIFSKH